MKRNRAVRIWLIVLSVVALGIVVGCAGAAGRAIGGAAGRAGGAAGAAGRVAPAVRVPPPVVYRPPVAPAIRPVGLGAKPLVFADDARYGARAKPAAEEGGSSGGGVIDNIPFDSLIPSGSGDDRKKK